MIAILLTKAVTREELAIDWAQWLKAYGTPPSAVLGHVELPFAFPERGLTAETSYEGVRVLTLDEFLLLHADDIDPDEEDEEDFGPDEETDE